MPLVQTRGAASAQGFGEFAQATVANYIEEMFSTYLYTGAYTEVTVNNGIDLAGKGGMVWLKPRSAGDHILQDSARGINYGINSNTTAAQANYGAVTSFTSTGFTDGQGANGINFVSWTFREQSKFFDVVTYTGNSVAGRTVAHNLGSVPGSIIVKEASAVNDWLVYHRNDGTTAKVGLLNSDQAAFNNSGNWFGDGTSAVPPTSTEFTVSTSTRLNASGETYVAYLFAHNAGGFGLTGTDNVISCGSYTGNGSATTGPYINLGYEPQWLLLKSSSNTQDWHLFDTMRGLPGGVNASGITAVLYPNGSYAEGSVNCVIDATGFRPGNVGINTSAATYIYIAIRRGPMKVPTLGTSVFDPEAYTGTSATQTITSGFPVDLSISKIRSQGYPGGWFDRLRGALQVIRSSNTDPEVASPDSLTGFDSMTGVVLGSGGGGRINTSPDTYAMWNFRRAPGFFDEVCYTGTGANRTVTHNLTVAPELMIFKQRDIGGYWMVYPVPLGNKYLVLQRTDAVANGFAGLWNSTAPTSSVFSLGTGSDCNQSGGTYVGYLFATCAGVSKVGTYTGTGTTLQINCGFTAGARFVLIKRTDSTGDWYVWDSARGIVAGNDPYLLLNSAAAEVTGTDYVDTYSAGFEISSTAPADINASAGSFIFLAIA